MHVFMILITFKDFKNATDLTVYNIQIFKPAGGSPQRSLEVVSIAFSCAVTCKPKITVTTFSRFNRYVSQKISSNSGEVDRGWKGYLISKFHHLCLSIRDQILPTSSKQNLLKNVWSIRSFLLIQSQISSSVFHCTNRKGVWWNYRR